MLRTVKLTLAVFGALAISITAASAAPLIGTGNPPTGVFGQTEANWKVSPTGLTTENGLHIVSGAADYPGAWVDAVGSGLTGKWITPYSNEATLPGGGPETLAIDDPNAHSTFVDYTYTLSGFDKAGSALTVKWASDNGATFALNGFLLSSILAPTINDQPFGSLTVFSILAEDIHWLATNNVFTVVVRNLQYNQGPNPTGLLVDISTVPLPPALLLFGSALVGMNWLRRRRPGQNFASATMTERS